MKQYCKAYLDIWFVINYQHEEEEYHRLEFVVYKIEGMDEEGGNHTLAPRPHAVGYVKFDGCMDITFDSDLHFCGVEIARQHAQLLEEIYCEQALVFPDYQ